MYEDDVRALIEKIQHGDFNLTDNEAFLLVYDNAVNATFSKLASAGKVNWDQVIKCVGKYGNLETLVFNEDNNFYDDMAALAAARYCLNDYDFRTIEISSNYFSPEVYEQIQEESYQKIINSSNPRKKIMFSTSLFIRLLNEKRYDIFTWDCYIPREVDINLILEKFPFKEYHSKAINEIVVTYLRTQDFNSMINSGLADKLSIQILVNIAKNTFNNENIISYVINRILGETNFDNVENIKISGIQKKDRTRLFEHLKSLGYLDLAFQIRNENLALTFQIRNENIEEHSDDYKIILDMMQKGKCIMDFPEYFGKFLQDEAFLEAAVKSFSVQNFISYWWEYLDEYSLIPKMINLIFQEIANGNERYLNGFICKSLQTYLDTMDVSDFSAYFLDDNFLQQLIKMRDYEFMLGVLNLILKFQPTFFDNLINQNKYDLFFELIKSKLFINGNYITLSEESQKKMIEFLKSNYSYFSYLFICNNNVFVWENPLILEDLINNYPVYRDYLLHMVAVNDANSHIYCEQAYEIIKSYYVKSKGYNGHHIDILKERFGFRVIKYLDSDNLLKICNYDDEKFNKLLALLPQNNMTMHQLEAVYDALKQYGFSKEHPEIVTIFVQIKASFLNKDDSYLSLLNQILPALDDKFYEKFKKEYPDYAANYPDPRTLLQMLAEKIKVNDGDSNHYLEVLHFITQYYIAYMREEYRKTYQMIDELELPYNIDLKDASGKLVKFLISEDVSLLSIANFNQCLKDKLIEKGFSRELALDCIEYYAKGTASNGSDLTTIRKSMKILVQTAKEIINDLEEYEILELYEKMDKKNQVKRLYYVPDMSTDFLAMLLELKADYLEVLLSQGEEQTKMYESLKKQFEKYGILASPSSLMEVITKPPINLTGDIINLAAFISYYSEIYAAEMKKLSQTQKGSSEVVFSPSSLFILADTYAAISSVYALILGAEDAKLIKSNPGPNCATRKLAKDERLKEAIQWMVKNFHRQEVTVPTFNHDFELSNGKKMQVIVGNFNNPCNLTHGERTGACMRIGGAGEGLFKFCLENKNGFHIRFQDPKTGKYISRVSGFRNGNTVFLNELRCSCDTDLYSDEDIVMACQAAAKMIIEMSKNSEYPIDNVVLHHDFATKAVDVSQEDIGVDNVVEGLGEFYHDVGRHVIVLATSRPNNELVPVNFDKRKVPTYKPARDRSIEAHSKKDIISYITRIDSMKSILGGVEYEYIDEVDIQGEIVYGFANNDWYIYIDTNGEIHENIIDIDPRAKKELEEARKLVQAYVLEKGAEETYGI